MSIEEAHKANEAELDSPLSFWQRCLVALAMWPGVLLVVFCVSELFSPNAKISDLALILAVVGSLSVAKYVWSFFARGAFRAGAAFGASGMLLLVAASIVIIGVTDEEQLDALPSDDSESLKMLSVDEASPESNRQLPSDASSLSGSTYRSAFDTCVDELHRRSTDGSMRGEAVEILSKVASPDLAEDAAQDVIISVCIKYRQGKVRELRPYFFRSIYNARADLQNSKKSRWQYCQLDETQISRCGHDHENAEMLKIVQAAMCRIDNRQAFVLRARADHAPYKEIAADLGISVANSRQLFQRGKRALNNEVEKLSGCRVFD